MSRARYKLHTHYCGRCNRNFQDKESGCKELEYTLCGDCVTAEKLLNYFGRGWLHTDIQETFDAILAASPDAPGHCVSLPDGPAPCEECKTPTLNWSCMGGKEAPRPLCFACEGMLESIACSSYSQQAHEEALAERLEELAKKHRLLGGEGGTGLPSF